MCIRDSPWDVFETVFTVGSVHEGTIIEMLDKGAVVALPYGVEGFATPKQMCTRDRRSAVQGVQPVLPGDVVRFLFFRVEGGGLQGQTVLFLSLIHI